MKPTAARTWGSTVDEPPVDVRDGPPPVAALDGQDGSASAAVDGQDGPPEAVHGRDGPDAAVDGRDRPPEVDGRDGVVDEPPVDGPPT